MMISLQKRGATTTPPPPSVRTPVHVDQFTAQEVSFSLEFHTAVIYMNNVNYEHLQYHWKTKGTRLKFIIYR